MANKKQLALLKRSVKAWNKWRDEHLDATIDLSGADLSEANLSGADLAAANLAGAILIYTDLIAARLAGASLQSAVLNMVDLSGADLESANLYFAHFYWVILEGTNFSEVFLDDTIFADVDLSTAKGLDSAEHFGPSTIGIDTIYKSKGRIPEAFLRGAGVPEDMITWIRELRGKAFEFYSCFISYSSKDQDFANRLHADLQSKGARVWFAPDDMKIGDRIHETIEDAIRIYDKLMVVLSKNSIKSAWVEREVREGLKREKREKRTMLFPVRLDDAVMETTQQWAHDIRDGRHIGDFRKWKEHDAYQQSFARLLRDLQGKGVGAFN